MGGARVITNEGACGLFGPLTLPIIGRVGDYGDMEDIQEDANVRFLLDKFGDEFDDFIEGCTSGGTTRLTTRLAKKVAKSRFNKKHPAWDGTLSGCWIAKKAWDKFSTQAWDENGTRRDSVGTDGWLDPQNLRGMGFKAGPEDKARAKDIFGSGPHQGDRYTHPYTHRAIDDHMSSAASYKGKATDIGLKFDAFVKALKKLNINVPKSVTGWAARTSVYRGHLLAAREEMREEMGRDEEWEKLRDQHPEMRWTRIREGSNADTQVFCSRKLLGGDSTGSHRHIILKRDGTHWVTGCPSREGHTEDYITPRFEFTPEVLETIKAMKRMGWRQPKRERFTPGFNNPYVRSFPEETLLLYGSEFLSDKLLPLTERLLCLEGNMYAANRLLAPTACGWQCGNNATQREVANMALSLVRARERRYRR